MSDFNTFIITSNINAIIKEGVNLLDSKTRYIQTINTLESIREKDPTSKIIFIDNSTEPLTEGQTSVIKSYVDYFEQFEHNLFTKFCNVIGSKGMGEAMQMERAVRKIKEDSNFFGKRIFKITGRYSFEEKFDISYYDNPDLKGKYAHKINQWDVSLDNFKTHRQRVVYFETRFWSFCSSLIDEYYELLQNIFNTMIHNYGQPMCNLEMCHWQIIPQEKLHEIKECHIQGVTADTGTIKIE